MLRRSNGRVLCADSSARQSSSRGGLPQHRGELPRKLITDEGSPLHAQGSEWKGQGDGLQVFKGKTSPKTPPRRCCGWT